MLSLCEVNTKALQGSLGSAVFITSPDLSFSEQRIQLLLLLWASVAVPLFDLRALTRLIGWCWFHSSLRRLVESPQLTADGILFFLLNPGKFCHLHCLSWRVCQVCSNRESRASPAWDGAALLFQAKTMRNLRHSQSSVKSINVSSVCTTFYYYLFLLSPALHSK